MHVSVDKNTEETNPHSNSLFFSLALSLSTSILYHTYLNKFNSSITNQHLCFYMSSTPMAMQSVKQVMSVVSTVVAVDYVGRALMDMVPSEVKEEYVESMVDYIDELYTYSTSYFNSND